jgi:hypothetical protein
LDPSAEWSRWRVDTSEQEFQPSPCLVGQWGSLFDESLNTDLLLGRQVF